MSGVVVALVLSSAVLHALWNFATRAVKGDLAVLWLSLGFSGVVSLPVAMAFLWFCPPPLEAWLYLLVSGVLNAAFFSLLGKAYEKGEISLVYPVARGSGVAGTALLALGFGIETITPLAGTGIATICAGILLIGLGRQAAGQASRLHAIALAVLSGAMIAGYSIIDKIAMGLMHPVIYVWGQYLLTAAFMSGYAWPRTKGTLRSTWARRRRYVLFIGPASLLTYLLILYAYRLGPVSSIVAFREVAVVLGCMLGFWLLKERLTVRKALGIAAIVAGLLLIKLKG
jgi:drug/metabolite transporter (DMT)-like permease